MRARLTLLPPPAYIYPHKQATPTLDIFGDVVQLEPGAAEGPPLSSPLSCHFHADISPGPVVDLDVL